MAKDVANGRRLEVDEHPRLVVFGYDSDQKGGKMWRKHLEPLRQELGFLIAYGDPKAVKLNL